MVVKRGSEMVVNTLGCYFGLKGRVQGATFIARKYGKDAGSPSWTTDLIALPAGELLARQTGPHLQLYVKGNEPPVGVLRSFQFDQVDTDATFNLELRGSHYLLQVNGTYGAEHLGRPGQARFLAGLTSMVNIEVQAHNHGDSGMYSRRGLREVSRALDHQ
jgi:hypothetical protein